MKRQSFAAVCIVFMLWFSLSCRQSDNHNISIHVSDTDNHYKMKAYFDKHETNAVDEYMDKRVGRRSHTSFLNTRIDGRISLDDHTTFYIKKYPGYLEIKFDKDQNSTESYYRVKSMCEGIKNVLAH